jgi:hypothetical protein
MPQIVFSSGLNKKRLLSVILILAFLALLWPLSQGGGLRKRAAERLLASDWHPAYRALPLLAIAHTQDGQGAADPALLDNIRQQLQTNKIVHSEFFWLELSVLELKAGRKDRAVEALQKARSLDKKITNMIMGPNYQDYRGAMGL